MSNQVRIHPWTQIQNEINKLFNTNVGALGKEGDPSLVETSQWIPMVDIQELQDKFVLHADVPGVRPEDIEISMMNDVLTIKGRRESHQKQTEQNMIRIERNVGEFYRRFSLPDTADPSNISAKGENGVIEIIIPKREKAQPRKITVQTATIYQK